MRCKLSTKTGIKELYGECLNYVIKWMWYFTVNRTGNYMKKQIDQKSYNKQTNSPMIKVSHSILANSYVNKDMQKTAWKKINYCFNSCSYFSSRKTQTFQLEVLSWRAVQTGNSCWEVENFPVLSWSWMQHKLLINTADFATELQICLRAGTE